MVDIAQNFESNTNNISLIPGQDDESSNANSYITKSNLFNVSFEKKIYQYSLQINPKSSTENFKFCKENTQLLEASFQSLKISGDNSFIDALEPSQILLDHIEAELNSDHLKSKMPLQLLDKDEGILYTPYYGNDLCFQVVITSDYIQTMLDKNNKDTNQNSEENKQDLADKSFVSYDIKFVYDGLLYNQISFIENMWKMFFKSINYVLTGDDIFSDYILMPYEKLVDEDFFRHYYFVKNCFVKLANKIYLKINPTSMVSSMKESLYSIITKSYTKFCEKNQSANQDEFRNKFVGKIVKAKYASWNQYYKITDICLNEKLSEKRLDFNGKQYSFLQTFKTKFPFLAINDLNQFIIKAVPLKSKFDKRRYDSQYHKVTAQSNNEDYKIKNLVNYFKVDFNDESDCPEEWIIPELFNLLDDIYASPSKYNFDKRPNVFNSVNKYALTYYIASKYVECLVASMEVRQTLLNWRITINCTTENMYFQLLDRNFKCEMNLLSPEGAVEKKRHIMYRPEEVRNDIWKYRLNQFLPVQTKYGIFCPKNEMNEIGFLLEGFKQCQDYFHYEFVYQPDCYTISKDESTSWENGLKNKVFAKSGENKPGILLCFTRSEKVENYLR